MSLVRSKNTKPEIMLRNALWHQGFRYRVNDKRLPGTPDIVLPKYRSVIFVHGCFWHGHKDCPNHTTPKTNREFWTAKITRNQERDQKTWRQLEAKGWAVIIVWECELKKARLEETIDKVVSNLAQNRGFYLSLESAQRKARALYREERRQQKQREQILTEELRRKFPH